jgi:hypothetical protein
VISVRAWLLKRALADVPDDAFIAIDELSIVRLVGAQMDGLGPNPRYRDHRGRFTRIKP